MEGGMLYDIDCSPMSVNGDVGRVELESFEIFCSRIPENRIAVFCNGFQSWTESREFGPEEIHKPVRALPGRLFGLKNYGDYHFKKYPAGRGRFHSYTYTYLRLADNRVIFFGSLSEDEGYTVFDVDLRQDVLKIGKECTGTMITQSYHAFSLFVFQGTEEEAFAGYFDVLGKLKNNLPARIGGTATGWTSWYNYYTRISEEIILSNLEAFAELHPIAEGPAIPAGSAKSPAVFQIDDGYQTSVGDWLDIKPEFPKGMKFIANAVKSKGFLPGLWLAPFVCAKGSKLFNGRQEWVLKDERGSMVSGGWNPLWRGTFYALDIGSREFRHYLEKVFRTVFDEWGFELVKLDFLYAAAMVPKRGKNRGQIMAEAMHLLRELAENKLILGCGVPLGSAFGIVDCCRIGSDVALQWEDRVLKYFRYRERVSTVNSLTSTIGRRHLGANIFLNDPDVFILRSKNCSLSVVQKKTLLLTNCLFGQLVFTSDHLGEYSEEELARYRSRLPHKPKRIVKVVRNTESGNRNFYRVEFEIEGRCYLAFINCSRKQKKAELAEGFWFCNDEFWGSKFLQGPVRIACGPYESLCFMRVETAGREAGSARGSKDFSTSCRAGVLAGTDGHIFPGSEVREINRNGGDINVELEPAWRQPVTVYLSVPGSGTARAAVNGLPCTAINPLPGLMLLKAEVRPADSRK